MSLSSTAQLTLQIVNEGAYTTPAGIRLSISAEVQNALDGTRLYRPDDFKSLTWTGRTGGKPCQFNVTSETTAQAARRLYAIEGVRNIVALNFASAKNPGGGFLTGAKAQEEDLARCSALYNCQLTQPEYYSANRACTSMLYTDHLIYSPNVPFFRDDALQLLDQPFLASIITSPAPNAGEVLKRNSNAALLIHETLVRRSAQVLQVAAMHGHRTLVLGAWGCGVFRNNPDEVAAIFATTLAAPQFINEFDQIIFAIYDRTQSQSVLNAFRNKFAAK